MMPTIKNLTNYMINSGLLACLCSGSTWSFLSGWWNYVQTGDPSVTPIRWKGFAGQILACIITQTVCLWKFRLAINTQTTCLLTYLGNSFAKKITSKVTDFIDRQKYKIDATWQISPGFRYTYTPLQIIASSILMEDLMYLKAVSEDRAGVETSKYPLSFFAIHLIQLKYIVW